MRQYDFDTVIPRTGTGSQKWKEMEPYHCPEDVIPFSVADMELMTLPEVREGLKHFIDHQLLGYSNPDDAFKEAVCSWTERRYGWKIQPEWLEGTPGVINAFFTAVHAFTQPGDNVLLLTPVYYPMYMAATRNDRGIASAPLVNNDGVYTIDFDALEEKAQDPKTTLMILCSPHNPSGRVWTREELERIGQICLDNDVLVFSDEIHCDLIMPGYHHTSFASIREEFAQHAMVAISPSKSFNLAGLQTANIIIPNPELRRQFHTELCRHEGNPKCNILGLEACRLAYTHGDAWLEQVIRVIDTNRALVTDYLRREFPAVKVTPLEGTYLLWMDFRGLGIEPHALAEILRKEAYLFFDDGFIFGDAGAGFERWNLACPTRYIGPALERLGNALRKHL